MNPLTTDRQFFAALIAGEPVAPGKVRLNVPDEWTQGRATYGGLVAAAGLKAMRALVEPERLPRSLHVAFVAPVAPGESMVEATVLRKGRAVTSVEAKITQAGAPCSVLTAGFGVNRESSVRVEAPRRPAAKPPEQAREFPFIPGMTPKFTRHFESRWTSEALPFSGTAEKTIGGWFRFRTESVLVDADWIVGMLDAWPPTVLPMMTAPAPASSLDWTMEFLDWDPAARSDQWWFYQSETDAAAHGYALTRAILWDPTGRPAALSRQTIAIFG